MRKAWNTVLKASEKHTQQKRSEHSDEESGILYTATPRMTAQTLINELVRVLYPCHSDFQLYRPTSVIVVDANTIDMNRTNHSSTDSILKMLFHLGYLTEHGTYQLILTMKAI